MKGRRTPPPSAQQARVRSILDYLQGQSGVFVLEVKHDDECPTITSQDARDCTCEHVDHALIPIGGVE